MSNVHCGTGTGTKKHLKRHYAVFFYLKVVVHFKKKTFADNLLVHVILSSVEKKLKFFDENIPGFFSI